MYTNKFLILYIDFWTRQSWWPKKTASNHLIYGESTPFVVQKNLNQWSRGDHLSIRNSPYHSLCTTKQILPPTSQNHEHAPHQVISYPDWLNERLNHSYHAFHNRLIRPCLDLRGPKVHQSWPRHHLPP